MGYYSKVAVVTDKEGMDKILEVANSNFYKPDKIKSYSYTSSDGSEYTDYVLVWDWVKWYIEDDIKNIDNTIRELPYYDYVILGEDNNYEEYHGEDGPYALCMNIGYYDSVNKIFETF